MNLSEIESIYTHKAIKFSTNNLESSFVENINVPFTADYLVVNDINYLLDNSDPTNVLLIRSDLFSMSNSSTNAISILTVNPIMFQLNKQVQGTFTFNLFDDKNELKGMKGSIVLTLQFIKLKK